MNLAFWQRIDLAARSVTPFLISLALVLVSVLPLPFPGFAPVMPARAAWSRNTEFSTARAAGFSPKLMFDSPSTI